MNAACNHYRYVLANPHFGWPEDVVAEAEEARAAELAALRPDAPPIDAPPIDAPRAPDHAPQVPLAPIEDVTGPMSLAVAVAVSALLCVAGLAWWLA
ncbi:hypothetical protein [Paracoccus aeridis]|uniref:hypothetical protein n=1 Tax=Paracoccus aeridis TaxID=1966466 RepID=UPI0010AA3B96|nr:hypothetical protein [Paracoccus aeridis]